jgi:hypothetical protein
MSITQPVCVFVNLQVSSMQCSCVLFSSVACPTLQLFFHLFHKQNDFRIKLFPIKYVFCFSLQLLSEIFLIIKRTERDMIKLHIGLNANYPLFLWQFNETEIFTPHFRQILKHQVSWKSVQWEPSYSMRTDGRTVGQTEMTKLTVAFTKFSSRPKNW